MNNSDFQIEQISIVDLRLDQANPRIGKKPDQNSCITSIMESKNFINLVEDVAQNGLGLAPLVAYKNLSDGKYVVMDGNRRITALKLLTNPSIANKHSIYHRIVDASKLAIEKGTIPQNGQISINVSSELKPIYDHMKLTHTGELSGVGQRNWSAMAQALFAIDQKLGDDNLTAACIILFANKEFSFKFDEDYFITILTRLINPSRMKEMNIKYNDFEVTWLKKDLQAEKVILRILTDIRDGNISTNDIFNQEQQREYLDSVYKAYSYDVNQNTNSSGAGTSGAGTSGAGTSGAGTSGAGTSGTNTSDSNNTRKPKPPTKPSWDRKHVVNKKNHIFDFSPHPSKLSDLYIELTKLELDGKKGTPISAAFAIRAFIEITVDIYRKKNNTGGGKSLAGRTLNAANHLKAAEKISSDLHLLIERYCSDTESFISIGSIQKYLHSTNFHPNKQTLNTFWDELYPFLAECLKT